MSLCLNINRLKFDLANLLLGNLFYRNAGRQCESEYGGKLRSGADSAHRQELASHKDGMEPMSVFTVFSLADTGILPEPEPWSHAKYVQLAQELEKLKEDPGEGREVAVSTAISLPRWLISKSPAMFMNYKMPAAFLLSLKSHLWSILKGAYRKRNSGKCSLAQPRKQL